MLSWQGLMRACVAALTFLASTRYLQGAREARFGYSSRLPKAITPCSERARHHEVTSNVEQQIVGLPLGDGATRTFPGKGPNNQTCAVGSRRKCHGVGTQRQPDEVGLRLRHLPALVAQPGHDAHAFGNESVNPPLQLVEGVQ